MRSRRVLLIGAGLAAASCGGGATVATNAPPTSAAVSSQTQAVSSQPAQPTASLSPATAPPGGTAAPPAASPATPSGFLDVPQVTLRLPIAPSFSFLAYAQAPVGRGSVAEVHLTATVATKVCDAGYLGVWDSDPGQLPGADQRKVGARWYALELPNGTPDAGCQGVNDAMTAALAGAQPLG